MKFFMIGLFTVLVLIGCTQSEDIEEKMPLSTSNERSDCAADGVGCKQFNPDL